MGTAASPGRTVWNVLITLLLLMGLWAVFLFALPLAVSIVEVQAGLQRFPPLLRTSSIALAGFTLLALWAALTTAIFGNGTPLPLSPTRRLVIQGPYAFVRNPLVIAFIGQVFALGAGLGSVPVLVYGLCVAVFWYVALRPSEERRFADRFGADWNRYRSQVRAWRPRLRPYRAS